jgi:hypothetical protein
MIRLNWLVVATRAKQKTLLSRSWVKVDSELKLSHSELDFKLIRADHRHRTIRLYGTRININLQSAFQGNPTRNWQPRRLAGSDSPTMRHLNYGCSSKIFFSKCARNSSLQERLVCLAPTLHPQCFAFISQSVNLPSGYLSYIFEERPNHRWPQAPFSPRRGGISTWKTRWASVWIL